MPRRSKEVPDQESENETGKTSKSTDKWQKLDAAQDWRQDGPFDIEEVDLDADDIERLDFGSLIVTPFDDMAMQLQLDPETGEVQALLVIDKQSAIEVALFAAPAAGSMLAEVRGEMRRSTKLAGGTMTLVEGPFGTEVKRTFPMTTPEGAPANQPSRTWFVEGPKWLLRGVIFGQASQKSGPDDQLLLEFFCNLVVRRGVSPRVPGDLIPLEIPEIIEAELTQK